eukprot:1260186-Rhodomonas_salina.1
MVRWLTVTGGLQPGLCVARRDGPVYSDGAHAGPHPRNHHAQRELNPMTVGVCRSSAPGCVVQAA